MGLKFWFNINNNKLIKFRDDTTHFQEMSKRIPLNGEDMDSRIRELIKLQEYFSNVGNILSSLPFEFLFVKNLYVDYGTVDTKSMSNFARSQDRIPVDIENGEDALEAWKNRNSIRKTVNAIRLSKRDASYKSENFNKNKENIDEYIGRKRFDNKNFFKNLEKQRELLYKYDNQRNFSNNENLDKLKYDIIFLNKIIIKHILRRLGNWLKEHKKFVGDDFLDETYPSWHFKLKREYENNSKTYFKLYESFRGFDLNKQRNAIEEALILIHTNGKMTEYYGLDKEDMDYLSDMSTEQWDRQLAYAKRKHSDIRLSARDVNYQSIYEENEGGSLEGYVVNSDAVNIFYFFEAYTDKAKATQLYKQIKNSFKTVCIIKNINVDEEFRGKGFGSKLLNNVFELYDADAYLLMADTYEEQHEGFDLIKFYEAFGFKKLMDTSFGQLMILGDIK